MKLRPQPRARRRPDNPGPRHAPRPRGGTRPRGRQARRPGVPIGRRLAGRLPSLRRILAALGALAIAAGLVALLGGPWLRVTEVAWAGQHYTPGRDLERLLAPQEGTSVLAVDTGALRDRLERLPAVSRASVRATLPGRVEVEIVERRVAFVWETASTRLLGSEDGVLFAALPREEALPDELAAMPRVSDERAMARLLAGGDRIPELVLSTAMRLAALDPAALGSSAGTLTVRLDDEFGFRLVADQPGWQVALGVYGLDPSETASDAAARLERQVTAVRTLFASRVEADIGWVDARNPGKVYFRAKG